jgi:hypothetical protein
VCVCPWKLGSRLLATRILLHQLVNQPTRHDRMTCQFSWLFAKPAHRHQGIFCGTGNIPGCIASPVSSLLPYSRVSSTPWPFETLQMCLISLSSAVISGASFTFSFFSSSTKIIYRKFLSVPSHSAIIYRIPQTGDMS